MKEWTAEDITIIDGLDWVRRNPERFLWTTNKPLQLFGNIVDDAIITTGGPVISTYRDGWWIVGGKIDWLTSNYVESVDELFSRVVPFPARGQNTIRGEVLLTAFANDVITVSQRETKIIKGDVSEKDLLEFADLLPKNKWERIVAFRMPQPD